MGKMFKLALLTLLAYCNAESEDENCIIQDYEGTQCIITIKCPYIMSAETLDKYINKRTYGCRDNDDYKIIYQLNNITLNEENVKTLESLKNVYWKQIIKFEMINGNLSQIPKEIYKAINLQELNLSFNKFEIQPDLNEFKNLKKFNLSHNFIDNKIDLKLFKNLTSLDFSNNFIKTIELGSEDLEITLEYLNFRGNQLTTVPDFTNYTGLQKLDLSHNKIDIRVDLKLVKGMTSLNLSNNFITDIDVGNEDLQIKLEDLDCSYNKLTTIPDFNNYTKLVKLDLSHNMIETQVNLFLKYVISLNISHNLIPTIEVGSDDSQFVLENLYCSHNKLTTIPNFTYYTKLVNIDLSFNMLDTEINFESLKYITSLDVSNNLIPNIEIGSDDSQFNLEEFDCSHNNLTIMPNFKNFMKLKLLTLSHNMICTDVNLDHLKNLTSLIVSENLIRKIQIGSKDTQLKLEYLDCSHNALTAVPDFTSNTNLLKLNVSHNAIGVEFDFKALKNLISLDISNNLIPYIETSRNDSKFDLEELDCRHNKLTVVPDFTNFTKLKKLDLSHNMITDVHLKPLKDVATLKLSNNFISNLVVGNEEFYVNLEELDCSSNKLRVSPDFSKFKNLKILDLSHNKINTNVNLKPLKFLTTLIASQNHIPEIGIGSENMHLNYIDLSHNKIKEIPVLDEFQTVKLLNLSNNLIEENFVISDFKSVITIDFSYNNISVLGYRRDTKKIYTEVIKLAQNKIQTIPDFYFENCVQLKKLDLSHNLIDGKLSTAQFIGISSLEELVLSYNFIQELGHAFLNFEHLNTLLLDSNRIKFISNIALAVMINLTTLNLSLNKIHTINNDAFASLNKLDVLNLSYNNLTKIEKNLLQNNYNLAKLDVSHNIINIIEPKSFQNNKIHEFNFAYNKLLKPLNWSIFDGLLISELDLRNTNIMEIQPEYFNNLGKTLERLYLSNNYLTDVSGIPFEAMKVLKLLDLSNNKLIAVPGSILGTNKTTRHKRDVLESTLSILELNLSKNKIRQIGAKELTKYSFLKRFNCSYCSIEYVDEQAFSKIYSLEKLDLSHNSLSKFDVDVSNIKFLKELYLNDNNIMNIDFIRNLNYLQKINLARNNIKEIDLRTFTSLINLALINLSSNKHLVITNHFENLPNLERVIVSQIKKVDFSNTTNTSIKIFDLSSSGVKHLSSVGVNHIYNLESLNLQDNEIFDIDTNTFKGMKYLTELNLGGNNIREIKNEIFKDCVQLEWLNLRKNNLISIKSSFDDLDNLKTLILSRNEITIIENRSFVKNSNLRILDLHKNKISYIYQYAFIGLTNLEQLNLKDNRLHNFGPWYLPSNETEVAVLLDNNLITSILLEEFANTRITMLSIGGNQIPNDLIYAAKQKLPNLNIRDESYFVSVGSGKNVNSAYAKLGSIQYYINDGGVSPKIITETSKIHSPKKKKRNIMDITKDPNPIVVSSQRPLEHVHSTENNSPLEVGMNLNQNKTVLSLLTVLNQKFNRKNDYLYNITEVRISPINDNSFSNFYGKAFLIAIIGTMFVIKVCFYICGKSCLQNK